MLKYLALQGCGCALVLACLPGATLRAQDGVLDEFYGSGVHNYYERDYFQAMNDLSLAIDGGSRDPRVWYYRGLSKLRAGDTTGAHLDLQRGAELESADVTDFYPVARSLERVQGAERQTLERYRAVARAQARQRQLRRDAMRYEERRRSETQVLRSVPVGPPPAPLVPPAPAEAPGPAGAAPAPPAAQPPVAQPPAEPAGVSPFDTPPAEAPATDSPFGDAAPAEAAPADAPAESDPFGSDMPADDAAPADDDNPFN